MRRCPAPHGYQSYKGVPALREAMSAWYERAYGVTLDPNTEILPLLGSKEGIMHVSMTFLEAGDEVLLPNPGYPTYRAAAQLTGATLRDYDLTAATGWLPNLDALAASDLSRVKLMWVNYPHMPTGTRADPAFLARLVDFARTHNILLVHDNPYSFILNDQPASLLAVPGAWDVALELNSLSKSHNMAGWRVGLLAGRADLLQDVLRFKSNIDSGMFRPVQRAAVAALGLGAEWFAELNARYAARRERVYQRPRRAQLRLRPGASRAVRMGRRAARLPRRLRPERRRALPGQACSSRPAASSAATATATSA